MKTQRYNLATVFICLLITLVYAVHFSRIVSNIPHQDDFYDAIFFLHLFNEANGWQEKISLLFWQYNEHLMIYTRLFDLAYFSINDRLDFFWLTAIGNLQLPASAILIALIFNTEFKKSNAVIIVPFLILLNPAAWLTLYNSTFATGGIGLIFLPVLMLHLLQNQRVIPASIILFLLVNTLTNAVIMLPLSAAYVCFSRKISAKDRAIFLTIAGCIFLLYLLTHSSVDLLNKNVREEQLKQFFHDPTDKIIGFLGLIGSLSFIVGEHIALPFTAGTIILAILLWMLLSTWKSNRSAFSFLLPLTSYLLFTLFACSMIRVLEGNYVAVYDSHYKIFSLTLFSIAISFLYLRSKSIYTKTTIIIFLLFFSFLCYKKFSPIATDYITNNRRDITKWSTSEKRQGELVWLSHAPQILLMSIREGYYSPFDSKKGALYQTSYPQKIPNCIGDTRISPNSASIENNQNAIAFSIIYADIKGTPEKIMLCSTQNNFLLLPHENSRRATIDKEPLPEGNYVALLKTSESAEFIKIGNVSITEKKPYQKCTQPLWIFTINSLLDDHLCKKPLLNINQ